jgi:hypothetical protein
MPPSRRDPAARCWHRISTCPPVRSVSGTRTGSPVPGRHARKDRESRTSGSSPPTARDGAGRPARYGRFRRRAASCLRSRRGGRRRHGGRMECRQPWSNARVGMWGVVRSHEVQACRSTRSPASTGLTTERSTTTPVRATGARQELAVPFQLSTADSSQGMLSVA